MGLIYGVSQLMHKIKVKLYPNYLPKGEGTFIARTDSEAVIDLPKLCAAACGRGGYEGSYDTLLTAGKTIVEETVYQICDGFTVNLGAFSLYPNIGGTFKTEHEIPDHKNHPLDIRTRIHSAFANALKGVHVEIISIANTSGCIDFYHDEELGDEHHMFMAGNMFILSGQKMKIEGDDPSIGVYFNPTDPAGTPVKVSRIIENQAGKIVGIAPQTGYQYNRIEVRTQYSHSGAGFLKSVRTITSPFILEEA